MPSTPSPIVVLVPVKLDAFVFNPAVCDGKFDEAKIAPITQPNYTFLRVDEFVAQHDVLPHIDLHLSSPSSTNLRLMDLGTGQMRRRRTGVYLHWSLPRAYRRGITPEKDAAQEASKFPPVPTRWLVIRRLHSQKYSEELSVSSVPVLPIPEIQAWVVESDKPNDINTLNAKVDLEVDVSPFIETNPQDIQIARQAEVFIGGKTAADKWKEEDEAGIRQELTVLTSSNPLFADYQPHNSNVFSMLDHFGHDDDDDDRTQQLAEATASYYVLGWHSSVTSDILQKTTSQLLPLSDRLGKQLMTLAGSVAGETSKDEGTPARVLCHGAMYDVKWNAHEKPKIVTADRSSKRLDSEMPVAVGTTVLDALLAFVKTHMHDEKEKSTADEYSVSNLKADIWRIHGLLLARDDGVDGQREAADLLNHHNYDRVQCGTLFHLPTPDTAEDGKTSKHPSKETIIQLAELNRVQYALDLTTRTVRRLRWDLFALWWKYVSSKKIDLAKTDDKTQPNYPELVPALSKRLETLLSSIDSLTKDVTEKNTALKAKAAAMPNAYRQRDPTLLVAGIHSGWPHDFMDPLKVRLKEHIMTADTNDLPDCRGTLQAIIKRTLPAELRNDGSALADEFLLLSPPDNGQPAKPEGGVPPLYHDLDHDPEAGEESFRDRWQNTQPWFPLFLEWEAEYTHIPKESWILEERLSTNDPMAARKLRYGIAPGGWPAGEPDSRHFSGRSLILPQPNFSLKSRIEQVFKNTATTATPDECLTEEEYNTLIKNVDRLPFMSALLTDLTDHLVTRAHGSHIKPNVRGPGKELKVIDDVVDKNTDAVFTAEVLELIGRESDLTPYGNMVRPENKYSLFKPVTHGRFRFTKINVIDKFGQAIHALNPVHPIGNCPADVLYPCVGEFYSSPIADESMPSEYVYLPPQINQFARLNSCFVVEDGSPGGSGWRPTTEWDTEDGKNPIWGWVVVNAPDNGIQLFLPDGAFYCAVRLGGAEGASTSAKWLPHKPTVDHIPTSTNKLECLAQKLTKSEYLKAFIEMIYEATRNGTSAPTAYSQFVSSLVGKPFALANMGWSLELAVDAYTNQSTLGRHNSSELGLLAKGCEACTKPDGQGQHSHHEFQIKFGDQDQVYDGLAGYFNVDATKQKLDFTKFYTYQRKRTNSLPDDSSPLQIIGPTNYPKFRVHWVSPESSDGKSPKSVEDIDKERNAELQVFGAILDPFTAVHAYSSFLPTTALQLPPFTWQSAMSKMTAFFHLGPLLVPTDVTAFLSSDKAKKVPIPPDVTTPAPGDKSKTNKIPIPAIGLAEWRWRQPWVDADEKETMIDLEIETLDQRPRFQQAPYTAIEGYLELVAPLMAHGLEKPKEK